MSYTNNSIQFHPLGIMIFYKKGFKRYCVTNFSFPEKKKSETHSRRKSRPLDGREGMAAQQHFLRRTQPLDSKLKTLCERKSACVCDYYSSRGKRTRTHTYIWWCRCFYVLRMPESHYWLLKMNEFDVGFLRVVFCVCKERLNGKWALTRSCFVFSREERENSRCFPLLIQNAQTVFCKLEFMALPVPHNSNGIIKEQTLAIYIGRIRGRGIQTQIFYFLPSISNQRFWLTTQIYLWLIDQSAFSRLEKISCTLKRHPRLFTVRSCASSGLWLIFIQL